VEGEIAVRRSLEESFAHLTSSARGAMAALLREHEKDEQAEHLMTGELVELDVGWCDIGDDGALAEVVAAFLVQDETVKKVYLYSCNIGPRGAKAIAEALKHNETVEEMSFYDNQIGDEGAEALIDALNYNVCMKWLNAGHVALKLRMTIEYLTKTRNESLIPAAVRRASLSLIAARRNITDAGNLAVFPKEIVRMIAMEVWATRKDPIWINALTESERTGESGD
jgi:methionine aminopeptidase